VVVVVSAGNDGTANPDAFASAVRAAGNGNVIIAGSVDSNNTISSFSDRAGTEAASSDRAGRRHLLPIFKRHDQDDDQRQQHLCHRLFRHQLFRPQIAGAAALLMQYFPNLTAKQAVALLLSTATTKGTGAGDTTYGAGVLNIAQAFTAQGKTTLAGSSTSQVLLGSTSIATSPAMGMRPPGPACRPWCSTATTAPLPSIWPHHPPCHDRPAPDRGAGHGAHGNQRGDAGALAGLYRGRASPALGADRLCPCHAPVSGGGGRSRVLAARVVARLTPGSSIAMAFSEGSDGIAAHCRAKPPRLHDRRQSAGGCRLHARGQASMAVRNQLGRWG
jgi:hypothetical protein